MTNFRKTTFSHVQQATAITVPITTMEWRIIFIRQIMDNFKNTVRLVMHMLRFRLTDPCTKTRGACVDRSSKPTQLQQTLCKIILQAP